MKFFYFKVALLVSAVPVCSYGQTFPVLPDSLHSYSFYNGSATPDEVENTYYWYDNQQLTQELRVTIHSWGNNYNRTNYTRNAQGLVTLSETYSSTEFPNGPWSANYKDEFTYDSQGRDLEQISYFADGPNGWKYATKFVNGYDDQLHRDSLLVLNWDETAGVWVNYRRRSVQYNNDGNITHRVERIWDEISGEWGIVYVQEATFLPDGNMFTSTTVYYPSNPSQSFINFDSTIYLANGRIDKRFSRHTDLANVFDSYETIRDFNYTPAGGLSTIASFSKPYGESVYSFTGRDSIVEGDDKYSRDPFYFDTQRVDNVSGALKPVYLFAYQYSDLPDTRVWEAREARYYNQGGESYRFQDTTWNHLKTVSTHTPVIANKAVCTFANPLTPGNCIRCMSEYSTAPMTLRLKNLAGQTLAQARVTPGTDWRPSVIPTGINFLEVWQDGQFLGSWKVIGIK